MKRLLDKMPIQEAKVGGYTAARTPKGRDDAGNESKREEY
jgi:hypothetical protein